MKIHREKDLKEKQTDLEMPKCRTKENETILTDMKITKGKDQNKVETEEKTKNIGQHQRNLSHVNTIKKTDANIRSNAGINMKIVSSTKEENVGRESSANTGMQ